MTKLAETVADIDATTDTIVSATNQVDVNKVLSLDEVAMVAAMGKPETVQ